MKYKLTCIRGKFSLNTKINTPLSDKTYYLTELKTGYRWWISHDYEILKEFSKLFVGVGPVKSKKIIEESHTQEVELDFKLKTDVFFNEPDTVMRNHIVNMTNRVIKELNQSR